MGFVETVQLHPKPTIAQKREGEQSAQDTMKNMSRIKSLGTLIKHEQDKCTQEQCLKEKRREG